jgi:uncharacterized protein
VRPRRPVRLVPVPLSPPFTGRSHSAPALRRLLADDAGSLASLNDAAHPAVPLTTEDEMGRLLTLSTLALGLEIDGALAGFVLAMAAGLDYDSENYRWFEARGVDHLYVDRIVVAESQRGRGWGPLLYAAVFDEARARGCDEVTCEVNLEPPNPGSLSFHRRLGFDQIGTQATKGGAVVVALMSAPVAVDH